MINKNILWPIHQESTIKAVIGIRENNINNYTKPREKQRPPHPPNNVPLQIHNMAYYTSRCIQWGNYGGG